MHKVQLFREEGHDCAMGDVHQKHPAAFVLVRNGQESYLCPEHLRQQLASNPELLIAVLVDLLYADARPRAGQLFPR
jgi:hypothetical protein